MPEKNIGLGGVNVRPGRLRALRPDVVAELVDSIRERGLINPITVRPRDSGGYWLIAGLHRLNAHKKLKKATIRCNVLDKMEADQAEMIEIDENLIRADLTPAEEALFIDRRKELYEKLHPETKTGGAPGKAGGGKKPRAKDAKIASFADETAKKSGKSKRKVSLAATRGKQGKSWLGLITDTCLDQGAEIDALLKLPPNERDWLIARACKGEKVSAKTRLKQISREAREKELGAKLVLLPDKKYGLIVCDDAWDYETYSRETGMDRHAANHYVVEDAHTADELHKVTKQRFECAARDCLLAMWSTVPHLAIAVDLLRKRGFKYVSHYVWGKNKAGTGHWNRNKHELMLLGVRGKIPCPAPGEQWDSLIMAPVGEHSAKPKKFMQMLEEYFPNLPKIELNCRGKPRPGWDAWGNEVELQEAAE